MSRSYRKTSIRGTTTAASAQTGPILDWTSLKAASRAIVASSRVRREQEATG